MHPELLAVVEPRRLDGPLRVLCVTGETAHGDTVRAALEDDSLYVATVSGAAAALESLSESPVDCLVTVHDLPDGTGPELIGALAERHPELTTVLYADRPADAVAVEANRAGAEAYIPHRPAEDTLALLATRVNSLAETARDRRRQGRTNRRLESLVAAAPISIIELDCDGVVQRWSPGAERMFGWSAEAAVGGPLPIIPEGEQETYRDRLRRVLDGGTIRREETRRRTKSGQAIDLLLSVVPVPGTAGEPTGVLAVFEDITPQKRVERQLRALQRTTRELNVARSIPTVGEIAVEAAADILELDMTGLWRYDARQDALVPVAMTERSYEVIDEQPRFEPGGSLAWRAFEDGELEVYDDLTDVPGRQNPDTAIGSEIIAPLGEQGLLITGATTTREFSDRDVDLFRVLGANTEAAMARAEREAELRRQNERLDRFTSVVSHDLRNPLSVAKGYLDLARESEAPEDFARVEEAHERMGDLIEDLLALARGGTTVEDGTELDLGTVARDAWGHVDIGDASLTVAEDLPTLHGDRSRLTQLFENLFRNCVKHGATGSAADDAVSVTVASLPDRAGFYVADDGPGIPADRRESVFDHGVSFADDGGTGFGLSIVADIARAHGWGVSATESADGGARFEFKTDIVPLDA